MKNNERICLIAGVGPGTGKESAKKFADSGYKVVMLARNIDFINSLKSEIPNSFAYKCDVSNMEEIKDICSKVIQEVGNPNIFIHNANFCFSNDVIIMLTVELINRMKNKGVTNLYVLLLYKNHLTQD